MKRALAIMLVLSATFVSLFFACGVKSREKDAALSSNKTAEGNLDEKTQKQDEREPKNAPWCSFVLIFDEPFMLKDNEQYELETSCFTENGILYAPVGDIIARLGGSFVSTGDVWYINYKGNVSAVMEEYNVLLFNSDTFIMDSTPCVRNGVLFLPVQALGKALSMRVSLSPVQQICAFGSSDVLGEEELALLRMSLGFNEIEPWIGDDIVKLAQIYGADANLLWSHALERTLYVSDGDGHITQLWADVEGKIHRKEYEMSVLFPPNSIFVENSKPENGLYDALTGSYVSETPEQIYKNELREATVRYMELLAASNIKNDETAKALLPAYEKAISGELSNEMYLSDKDDEYQTHIFDAEDNTSAWQTLVDKAQVGDFLLFRAEQAGAEYGCFNHSALIVEKSENAMRLLHARGAEYGVGSLLDMDVLQYEDFFSEGYYSNYGEVFLCTSSELEDAKREGMVQNACDKYEGYQFGYGGRMGLREVNCAELIDDTYRTAGVPLVKAGQDSRLKEVLKGNTKELVPIPDDLMLSGNAEVKAVWKKY